MRLSALSLQQFRSYGSLELDLSKSDVHVLIGQNGAGKTNILEAVSILSLMKSCLGSDESDLMQWETDFYKIRGDVLLDCGDTSTLEVVSQMSPRKAKACFINDVKQSVTQMVGRLPTVTFLPQNLHLFSGPPAQRRALFDQLLCQVSSEYLPMLVQYQKMLKQRNALLRSIAEGRAGVDQLGIWDHEIAAKGAWITLRRLELMNVLQCTLEQEIRSLGQENWSGVELVYERKGTVSTDEALQAELCDLLKQAHKRDIALQSTSVGPHRDDWHLDVEGRSLQSFASRGQQRTAVLALLFLEVSYLELARNERPVILLDDVFSELDDHHQSALLTSLKGHQVLITGTHVPQHMPEGVCVWKVEEGSILSM